MSAPILLVDLLPHENDIVTRFSQQISVICFDGVAPQIAIWWEYLIEKELVIYIELVLHCLLLMLFVLNECVEMDEKRRIVEFFSI